MFLDWLSDPDDPRVVFALTKRCGICGHGPGVKCGDPIYKRLVHLDRTDGYKAWEGKQ